MTVDPTSVALRLASDHGIVTTSQLRTAGLSADQVAHLCRREILTREARGIFRVTTAPRTWEQRQYLALLCSGPAAVASHRAAGRLLGLAGLDEAPVELSVPRGRRGRAARGVVHQVSSLPRRDLIRRSGMWLTNPSRAVVDLAAVVDEARLEVALDDALRRGLTTLDHVAAALERVGGRGRGGTALVRALLDERGEWLGTTDSALETMLLRVLLDSGLPHPVPQFELVHGDERIGRFDFAYPDSAVVIEADSEQWHMRRDRFVNDRTRRDRATAIGWSVFEFTHHHITRQQGFVAATVRAVLSRAA